MRRLFVIGDLNVDYLIDGQSFADGRLCGAREPIPGGNALNAACAFAREGFDCVVIGSVGADPQGDFLRDAIRQEGLDSAIAVDPARATGVCHIVYERPDRYENHIKILNRNHANQCEPAVVDAAMAAKRARPGDAAFLTAVVLARQGAAIARDLSETIDRHGAKLVLDVVPHDLYRRSTGTEFASAFPRPALLISEFDTLTRLAGWRRNVERPDESDWGELFGSFCTDVLALRYGFGNIGKEAVRARGSSCDGDVVLKPETETGYAALSSPIEKRGFGDRLTARLLREIGPTL